ncbi:MAG: DUF3108 domain-containing protein [Pseudomonadota bacterium]|nr:DUF3108 domain-containing protein [Pseudomonadota bacterium]
MAGALTPARPGGRALAVALGLALLAHALALGLLGRLLRPPSLLSDVATPFYTRTLMPEAPAPLAALATSAVTTAPARPTAVLRPADALDTPQPTPPSPPASTPEAVPEPAPEPSPPRPADAPDTADSPATPPAPSPPAPSGPDDTMPVSAPEPSPELALEPAPEPATPTSATALPEPAQTSADTAHPPAPDTPASLPSPPASTASATSVAAAEALPADDTPAEAAQAPASAAASAASPAFLATWPTDTRLRYRLGGYYRGELHGDAQVLWQRQGTRYQATVQLDVGILLSSRFTSQGDITPQGLRPEVYEEQIRQRRRGVRMSEDVRLNNGQRLPRPAAELQDAASQFVELAHRFATGRAPLTPGSRIDFWLARPNGVDEWTYDVIGEETLHLPRLGPVQAFHLKPRPLSKPSGSISAEIWFAPSLQYLPVRIRLTQGADTHMDLLVETVEQQ